MTAQNDLCAFLRFGVVGVSPSPPDGRALYIHVALHTTRTTTRMPLLRQLSRLQQQKPMMALMRGPNVDRFRRSFGRSAQTWTTATTAPQVAVVAMMPWFEGRSSQQQTLGTSTLLSPAWIAAAAAATVACMSSSQRSNSKTTDCCGIAGVVGSSQKNHDARYVCGIYASPTKVYRAKCN
jgi:hypothetical protein